MYGKFQEHLQAELASIKEAGLYKDERNISSAQSAEITLLGLRSDRRSSGGCENIQ